MVIQYFGFPRSGKTTLLTRVAIKAQRKIDQGRSNYEAVYSNVGVNYPGIRSIKWDYVGRYDYKRCLILIDEATLFADNRNFKAFEQFKTDWLMTHGHDKVDLIVFCQSSTGIDKKIRDVTERVGFVRKVFCWSIITYLPRSIVIPENTGEVTMGFRKPKPFELLWNVKIFYRPKWYPYFDSWHSYVKRPAPIYDTVPGDPPFSDVICGKIFGFFRRIRSWFRTSRLHRRQRKQLRSDVRFFRFCHMLRLDFSKK